MGGRTGLKVRETRDALIIIAAFRPCVITCLTEGLTEGLMEGLTEGLTEGDDGGSNGRADGVDDERGEGGV